jgi:hypothetical protein
MTRGRPTKFNERRVKVFLQNITEGVSVQGSAALAGIHKSTVQHWIERGQDPVSPKPYRDFSARYEAARSIFERLLVSRIRIASALPQHHGAAAWLLKVKFPELYRDSDTVKLVGGDPGDQPIQSQVLVANVTPAIENAAPIPAVPRSLIPKAVMEESMRKYLALKERNAGPTSAVAA